MQKNFKTRLLSFSVVVFLLASLAGIQFVSDLERSIESPAPVVLFPPQVLKTLNLGLDGATASLIWLSIIQEISSARDSYGGLVHDIRTVNMMDSKWSYPYAFAVLVVPALNYRGTSDAILIGQEGVIKSEPDWHIPFYLASLYDMKKDRENALRYFNIAARTPGIPDGLKLTAISYGTHQKDSREQTKEIWAGIYESSEDEIVRGQAKANVEHLDILNLLEGAIAFYKKQTGVYPHELKDLVNAKILQEIPEDPFGIVYDIGKDGKLIPRLGNVSANQ